MNPTDLLNAARDSVLQREQKREVSVRPCHLVVCMDNTAMTTATLEALKPVAPGLRAISDEYLVAPYPSQAEAQLAANTISSVLHQFDRFVIQQPFEPNWLAQYEAVRRHGVNVAMADIHFSPENTEQYLAKRAEGKAKDQIYRAECAAAKEKLNALTPDSLATVLADYLGSRFGGWEDPQHPQRLMATVVRTLLACTPPWNLFDRDELWSLSKALRDKAQSLPGFSGSFKSMDEGEKYLKPDARAHEHWERTTTAVYAVLRRDVPGMTFTLAGEEKPVTVDLARFSEDPVNDLPTRLSPDYMRYQATEQGVDRAQQVAGAIACYYYIALGSQQVDALEWALREESRMMDQRPYFGELPRLAEKARQSIGLREAHTPEARHVLNP